MDIIEITGKHRLLTAIELQDLNKTVPLGQALLDGGISVAEITFRTQIAAQALYKMVQSFPDMIIGAGSIIHVHQAEEAITAGAKFIVAAGFNPVLVDWCIDKQIPILPGVATASEITMGVVRGINVLKFFPSEVMGGTHGLKALSAPFPGIKFIPMGGISAKNLENYIRLPFIHAIGGTWMVNKKLIEEGNFSEISRLTREALAIIKEVRG